MRSRNLNVTVSSEVSAFNHDDERYTKMGCIQNVQKQLEQIDSAEQPTQTPPCSGVPVKPKFDLES